MFYEADVTQWGHESLSSVVWAGFGLGNNYVDITHPPNVQRINFPIHDPTDLKHLMAVMLLTRLARKAVVVVREVTNMDTRAWLRVALTLDNEILNKSLELLLWGSPDPPAWRSWSLSWAGTRPASETRTWNNQQWVKQKYSIMIAINSFLFTIIFFMS